MRLIVFALTSLLLVGHTARADSGAVIVTATGKVAERDRSLAEDATEKRLRDAGWEFTSKPLSPKEVQAVTACLHNVEAWPCVSRVVEGHGIHRVAAVTLRRSQTGSGTPELIITGRLVLPEV